MFTRYKGTQIPANYSGVRFRDFATPPTEMKTHKPSPSYTSAKTSVSPAFRNIQLQRENFDAASSELGENEASEQEFSLFDNDFGGEISQENNAWEQGYYQSERLTVNEDYKEGGEAERDECSHNECSCKERTKCERKKEPKGDVFGEISAVLDKIFKGIRSEDFLLLAIMLLIMGDGKSEAKGALLPLALILLYS